MKYFIFDTETTSLDSMTGSIIQLSFIYEDTETLETVAYDLKCQPIHWDTITDEALAINRTSRETLKTYPDPKEMYTFLRGFLCARGTDIIPVGYNVKFDIAFLDSFFKYFDSTDSVNKFFSRHSVCMYEQMKMLKASGVLETPSLKLEKFFALFGYDARIAHDAMADANMAYQLFKWEQGILQQSIGKIKL